MHPRIKKIAPRLPVLKLIKYTKMHASEKTADGSMSTAVAAEHPAKKKYNRWWWPLCFSCTNKTKDRNEKKAAGKWQ